MESTLENPGRTPLLAAMALFALVLALAAHEALALGSAPVFAWVGVGAAAAGVALLAVARAREDLAPWLIAAAVLPLVYLVFYMGERAITGHLLALARLAAGLGAAAAWLALARRLPGRVQYAACVAALGGAAVFFQLWEPPAPVPVPIARSLVATFPRTIPVTFQGRTVAVWKGKQVELTSDVVNKLKADEYLNLSLEETTRHYQGMVFVTYNANAMSNIPHVPWVCMTQSGYEIAGQRKEEVGIESLPTLTVPVNVMLFTRDAGGRQERALMFQYFNVGHSYTIDRQIARFLATTGSIGEKGSYLSQTQVVLYLGPNDTANPLAKDSLPYQLGVGLLNAVVPLLEKDYYPDLGGSKGG